MPASFFDVDGTLVRTNLLYPTVFYLANQPTPLRSLGALARAVAGGPRMALAEMVDRRRFKDSRNLGIPGGDQERSAGALRPDMAAMCTWSETRSHRPK